MLLLFMENIHRLRDMGLLKEMINYEPVGYFNPKAYRVYHLCLKRGHYKLAHRIFEKYGLASLKSDLIMAFEMSLIAKNI